ncbi:MAG: tRNA 2-thiouridine(34) synthase MnmA [Lentisphaeria bacterium]|nr:tRNA 2-thiouridine(34) synthase MnmA [Lentisphaeria bacterium]
MISGTGPGRKARGRIVVAMSGGVDSSVAALLLARDGREVVGATLLLKGDVAAPDPALERFCAAHGIVLHAIPAAEKFAEKVLRPAAREYDLGRTPNPCCECNEVLKFALLAGFARELGADALATGHYCVADGTALYRGSDRTKDQSYFLYRLKRELLPFLRFPLGGLTKKEVREIARSAGLECAERPDSQDVCFAVPGECCGDTLLKAAGLPPRPGSVVFGGRIVGRHGGIHRCTLGQRGGLGIALVVPAYVKRIDGKSGEVELCTDRAELACRRFRLSRVNWQQEPPAAGSGLEIQIRYRSRPARCRVFPEGETCRIETYEPLFAVTPGQAGVIYENDRLVGGGVIELQEPTPYR